MKSSCGFSNGRARRRRTPWQGMPPRGPAGSVDVAEGPQAPLFLRLESFVRRRRPEAGLLVAVFPDLPHQPVADLEGGGPRSGQVVQLARILLEIVHLQKFTARPRDADHLVPAIRNAGPASGRPG